MKMFLKFKIVLIFVYLGLTISCSKKTVPSRSVVCMDTLCSVNLFEDGTEKLYEEIFARLKGLENKFSITEEESYVNLINNNAGVQPVRISEDVFNVLYLSSKVSEFTEGAFDVTANPVIRLWGINTEKERVPTQKEIDNALLFVGNDRMHFAEDGVPWCILEKGMSINFGGIAKGYAADCVCEILEEHKVRKAVIDLGGNVYVYGKKDDGTLWSVGIKNPDKLQNNVILKLRTEETSVVTSGRYERFFEKDGNVYHHIFDPKTGYPVKNGLASVTVICKTSSIADALSTAFFVMGEERALSVLKSLEDFFNAELGIVFIYEDGKIRATDNLKGKLEGGDITFVKPDTVKKEV